MPSPSVATLSFRDRRALWTGGAALLLCLLAGVTPARAQTGYGLLRVVVVDSATGQPVRAARISVAGTHHGATNERGVAEIARVPTGEHEIRIALLGFEPYTARLRVGDGGGAHTARLAPAAIQLAAVTVRQRAQSRQLRRFYTRAERGSGAYVTRDQIDRLNPRRVSDLFYLMPGMSVAQLSEGDAYVSVQGNEGRLEGGGPLGLGTVRECPILYYIDGTPVQVMGNGSIDQELLPDEIEGIEVYRRSSAAPAQYQRLGANCGIVLIWKREQH